MIREQQGAGVAQRIPESVRTPTREAVKAVTRRWGQATADRRDLPDALIIGGQRCGTTSLFRTLTQHPAILPPMFHKGVHYFDVNYGRGPKWYVGHFPTRAQRSRVASSTGMVPVALESSPYYMFHPLAAPRIAETIPDVKLLLLIRDPVERAYSAWAHEYARGFETLDFAAALEAEDGRVAGEFDKLAADPNYESHAYRHQAYRARGRYIERLRALEEHFDREQLLVIDSHRFFTEPDQEYDRVLAFLGLSPLGDVAFERHNARPRSKIDPALESELRDYFRSYDQELEQWLGWQPSWMALQ